MSSQRTSIDAASTTPTTSTTRARRGWMIPRTSFALMLTGFVALTLVSAVLAVGLGPVAIAPGRVLEILSARAGGAPIEGSDDFIVWTLRTPRVVQAIVVGAGLAMAGAVVQAVVRNTIADPYLLGLSSGASVGAVLVLGTLGAFAAGSLTLPLAAFAGALLAGVLVFLIAQNRGQLRSGQLIMVGLAIGQLLGGVTSFLILRSDSGDAAQQVMFWLLGSLSGAQWRLAVTSSVIIAVLTVVLCLRAGRLNLLALGDDAATALGVNPTRERVVFFVLSAFLVGTVVAVSGSIGFVGLIVPNLARLLVGADHRRVVPLSAVMGALLVVWADTGARLLLAPTEVPIGILTALIGVPVFVWAVRRSRTGQPAL